MNEHPDKKISGPGGISPNIHTLSASIFILIVTGMLAGAASIPFIYESQSILYKLGADKVFLRAGKMSGLLAATLLLLQLAISGRFKAIDDMFGPSRRYLLHRINAVSIAILALLHPLLVFAPEDLNSIPVSIKYWPEILGAVLLILIWFIASTAQWRIFLNFSFNRWLSFHHTGAFIAIAILMIHILYVSDTFTRGLPRFIVVAAGAAYILTYGWTRIRGRMSG